MDTDPTAPREALDRRGRAGWPRLDGPLVASVVIGAVYFVMSRGVENFFPLTVADMYANRMGDAPSRIVALDARGVAHEVDGFVGWRCEGSVDDAPRRCAGVGDVDTIGYVDRSIAAHIRENPGDGAGEPLRVVRRVWRLDARPGPPPRVDCPIVACRARRR